MKAVVVGGGIAGLAAARQLESLLPEAEVVLVEGSERLGGKVLTERADGFVVEGAPDSMLARKARGIELCDELGLAGELVGRRPEHARTFVRRGDALHALPEGLTGMVPTDLDALAESGLLSAAGRERAAAEAELPPAPGRADESVASFFTRRFGREAYEALVEPLVTGIYGGDGELLSLRATFPQLRALELEHGSLTRGLLAQPAREGAGPPFVTLRSGMGGLVDALVTMLHRTRVVTGVAAREVARRVAELAVGLADGSTIEADGIVLATPPFVTAGLLDRLDADLAAEHASIPCSSSAIVTLAYRESDVADPLDGYGYVVPQIEGTDVLACTWTSRKWEARAPAGFHLLRVYVGRYGRRDVTEEPDRELLALARDEVAHLGIRAEPVRTWIRRWPRGMPQYVLGHPERLDRIDAALEAHPRLALAGAAYRGVGIPDCIRSGEAAAERVAVALAGAHA